MLSVFAAFGPKRGDIEIGFGFLELFDDGLFDGEAVVVESGDVGGAKAHHGAGFDGEIFEDFVQSGTDMDR